jgi:RimJ/RimL family protein N-acetyltransferase
MLLAHIRFMTPPETLRTARLLLRKPTREDATLMFAAYGQDHEVAHYVTWCPHTCVSDSEAVIDRFLDLWDDGCGFHWLLFQYGGSELLGAIGVRREAHRLELGYVLARRHWGYGIYERSGDSSGRLGV